MDCIRIKDRDRASSLRAFALTPIQNIRFFESKNVCFPGPPLSRGRRTGGRFKLSKILKSPIDYVIFFSGTKNKFFLIDDFYGIFLILIYLGQWLMEPERYHKFDDTTYFVLFYPPRTDRLER